MTTASPAYLRKVVAEAGFGVDEVVELQQYRGRPRRIGVRARRTW